ncbi:MAG: phosphate/phosphite/phosphonate ABC transporter substrate-binding protein [Methylococcales bacterium]|nr:phosphate/phosphite/phosphonate ABC transporter substrate-binding protein [Methylococcales bacterium]
MSKRFTVSPDFSPDYLSGWYLFNKWMQQQTGLKIKLELYSDFYAQRIVTYSNEADLVYVNPFDASMLVRDKGFLPLAKVAGNYDETVIVAHNESSINSLDDLKPDLKLAMTEDPNINMIGMMLLEAIDLEEDNIKKTIYDNHVLIVKNLLEDKMDAGLFLAKAYDELSWVVKKQLKILLQSEIGELHHTFLISPNLAEKKDEIQSLLINMDKNREGQDVLKSLGFDAWITIDDREMEFMIDLIDALSI